EAFHRRGGDDALGRTADAHQCMDIGSRNGGGYSGGKVAVGDQADACAGGTDVGHELFVTRAVEANDREIIDIPAEPAGNVTEIVLNRRIDIDGALTRGADDDLVHIDVRRVEQPAAFSGSEHGNGVVRTEG